VKRKAKPEHDLLMRIVLAMEQEDLIGTMAQKWVAADAIATLVRGAAADDLRLWLNNEQGPITGKGMTAGPIPMDAAVALVANEEI
jgi:hypothetical protein